MAEIQPLRALHYDVDKTGGLDPVVAPPYDVIDANLRAQLQAKSPYNVVEIDLPQTDDGEDIYEHAAATLNAWKEEQIIVQDTEPAIWPLTQDYVGPDGYARRRKGFLAKVRVQEYGPGRIRPHERTHPGPKEDRLRLTRATKANLSPIFSLFSDPANQAWQALEPFTEQEPFGQTEDGTWLWRVTDPEAINKVIDAVQPAELLIADGHHRYETARVYADEIGGEGPHRYVLMCLVALEDPGLTVFPTHRLLTHLNSAKRGAIAAVIERDFEIEQLSSTAGLYPRAGDTIRIGYIDAHAMIPFMLTLKDPAIAAEALADHSEPYQRLDTAVFEALILKQALGMTDDDIDHLNGLGYARDDAQALELVTNGTYDAAFMMAPTPVARVQEVAASGESMPPKSTYFVPKVPTGLVFNPLA